LLDGDLASNYLSWQWIASTFSRKPYLSNAENVAKFAPVDWHSYGSCIDCSYEDLEKIATSNISVAPASTRPDPTLEPELFFDPRDVCGLDGLGVSWLEEGLSIKNKLHQQHASALYLVHPWMLKHSTIAGAYSLGIIHLPFHQQFPWSAKRWHFVLSAMKEVTESIYIGNLKDSLGMPVACSLPIVSEDTLHAGYGEFLRTVATVLEPTPRFFPNPSNLCNSFSQFWKKFLSENLSGF
jgi:deoxyribodipyrimidine photo-lyase